MTETERIAQWLERVADGVLEIESANDPLAAIRNSYDVLSVMALVARKEARLQGTAPLALNPTPANAHN